MNADVRGQVAKAIREALRKHNAFQFSDRSTYDALADAAIESLGLAEERRTKGEHEQRLALWHEHKSLAEAAHERGDIPEANYQYGWVDALAAIEFSGRPVVGTHE